MKKIFLLLVSAIGIFTACKKDRFGTLATSVITIQAKYPATFSQLLSSGANITLTNIKRSAE